MASQAPAPAAAPAPAPGETSLPTLLSTLTPILHPSTFCFLALPLSRPIPSDLCIQCLFLESEGRTIITTPASASAHGLEYTFPCRMITLNVHSSLEAVGFIAHVAGRLSEKGIGTNPVSGFFHDHVFVPEGREREAMECLEGIAGEGKEKGGSGGGEGS